MPRRTAPAFTTTLSTSTPFVAVQVHNDRPQRPVSNVPGRREKGREAREESGLHACARVIFRYLRLEGVVTNRLPAVVFFIDGFRSMRHHGYKTKHARSSSSNSPPSAIRFRPKRHHLTSCIFSHQRTSHGARQHVRDKEW